MTHREVEALLGGGAAGSKQRRRLVERGWLPHAPMLTGDRDALAVYPEFALAALVVSASAPDAFRRPIEAAAQAAERLYGSEAYSTFHRAVVEAFRLVGSRDVVTLAKCVAEIDSDGFSAWRDEVVQCTEALSAVALQLESLAGRVVEVGDVYVINIDGEEQRHPVSDAPQSLSTGDLVTCDRVHVGSAVRAFLLPVPELDVLLVPETDEDTENMLARALFDGLQGHVRELPRLPAIREPVDGTSSDVAVPWSLLAGANSMSRPLVASAGAVKSS